MRIARTLGIHICNKCNSKLIDQNFLRCGMILSGKNQWEVFFDYKCPSCKYKGSYIIDPATDGTLPGEFFRQFGNSIDEYYERQKPQIDNDQLKDLLDDIQPPEGKEDSSS